MSCLAFIDISHHKNFPGKNIKSSHQFPSRSHLLKNSISCAKKILFLDISHKIVDWGKTCFHFFLPFFWEIWLEFLIEISMMAFFEFLISRKWKWEKFNLEYVVNLDIRVSLNLVSICLSEFKRKCYFKTIKTSQKSFSCCDNVYSRKQWNISPKAFLSISRVVKNLEHNMLRINLKFLYV